MLSNWQFWMAEAGNARLFKSTALKPFRKKWGGSSCIDSWFVAAWSLITVQLTHHPAGRSRTVVPRRQPPLSSSTTKDPISSGVRVHGASAAAPIAPCLAECSPHWAAGIVAGPRDVRQDEETTGIWVDLLSCQHPFWFLVDLLYWLNTLQQHGDKEGLR